MDATQVVLLCLILYTVVLKIKCLFNLQYNLSFISNQGLAYNKEEVGYNLLTGGDIGFKNNLSYNRWMKL